MIAIAILRRRRACAGPADGQRRDPADQGCRGGRGGRGGEGPRQLSLVLLLLLLLLLSLLYSSMLTAPAEAGRSPTGARPAQKVLGSVGDPELMMMNILW